MIQVGKEVMANYPQLTTPWEVLWKANQSKKPNSLLLKKF